MSAVHIWTTNAQPATRWRVPGMPPRMYIHWRPLCLVRCVKCGKLRRAKNCNVKAYYDAVHVFCAGACPPKPRRKRRMGKR